MDGTPFCWVKWNMKMRNEKLKVPLLGILESQKKSHFIGIYNPAHRRSQIRRIEFEFPDGLKTESFRKTFQHAKELIN